MRAMYVLIVTATSVSLLANMGMSANAAAHNARQPNNATYIVNGKIVMSSHWLSIGKNRPIEYMPLSDLANLALPTLHLESSISVKEFNLRSMWEPNLANVLSRRKSTVAPGEMAFAVNGHPYVLAHKVTRVINAQTVTYVPVSDVATFLQKSLNVLASSHGTDLSMDIGKTLFQFPQYMNVKRGQVVPIYDSGQVLLESFPQTTKMPEHMPWLASPLGVASAYAWNIVPPGYEWYWPNKLNPEKSIKNSGNTMESIYRGERVEFSLEKTVKPTKSGPSLADVKLVVGKTTYLMQLFRPKFTYEWALYDVLEYPGVR